MLKLKKVEENYKKQLEEYQMYYTDSFDTDKSIRRDMKKQAEARIPQLKYYEGELNTTRSLIRWLEGTIEKFEQSTLEMNNMFQNNREAIKIEYGSMKVFEDCYMREQGQLMALQNLLSYLKS